MFGMFLGFWTLGETATPGVPVLDGTGAAKDPPLAPTFRVYGAGALMANGTGSLSQLDVSGVAGAGNASPIQITTSAPHNLQTGQRVTVAGVLGNSAANGDWTVTVTGPTTFTLNGSAGNGAYAGGGTVHVTGLYQLSLPVVSGNGYLAGQTYDVWVNYTISGVSYSQCHKLGVV